MGTPGPRLGHIASPEEERPIHGFAENLLDELSEELKRIKMDSALVNSTTV